MLAPDRGATTAFHPNQIEYIKARRLVNDYLQPPKVTRKFELGQRRLAEVRDDMETRMICPQRPRIAAARWKRQSIVDCADMAAHASLYPQPKAAGAFIICAPIVIRRKNNADWFCHTLLRKKDGKMKSEKRAVEPYIVPIAEDEKDLYDKQRIRASA